MAEQDDKNQQDDKPKTLAEMELESRTEDVESSDDTEHEHEHSDELSYKEDPKKIRLAHSMLLAMSLGGLAVVLLVVGYLLFTFEGRNPISDPVETAIEESNALVPLPGQVFYINQGLTPAAQFLIADSPDNIHQFNPDESGSLQPFSDNRNPTWQVSRDGNVIAYQLNGASNITVVTAAGSVKAFSDISVNSITDWIMTPDGSRIIALGNKSGRQQLLDYNVINKTARVGDKSFSVGGNSSKLHHGSDGFVRQFAFTGADRLSFAEYSLSEGRQDNRHINSPRFPENIEIMESGLSPDGTLYAYSFVRDGEQYLGMTSLNSQTVRAIYLESRTAASISAFYWAPDSRTMLVEETQGGNIARLVKLDTGPLTTETIIDADSEGLSASEDIARQPAWSLDAGSFTFFNGGSIWLYELGSGQLERLAQSDNFSSSTITGWYSRNSGIEPPQEETAGD